jgi:hypothetical protein
VFEMNERIRELANQANDLANRELEQLEAADGRARDLTEYKKRYTEYLVDLVVRECMDQCEDMDDRYRIGIRFSI